MAGEAEFAGKVVLVTGSSSGIGAATAVEFAKLGARVVITGRTVDKLRAVEQACQAASSAAAGAGKKSVLAVPADVTKDEDLRRLIDSTLKEFGQLDVLVNNAGAGANSSILAPNAVEAYDFALNTNLRSVFVLTHLAIPHLIKTKGNVVNVSSVGGTKPFAIYSAYCMAKAGLDMFTQCLALEVGPVGVRVNCVKPGGVASNFGPAQGIPSEVVDKVMDNERQNWPLRRLADPVDISHTIVFLASDKAVNMTGSCVVNDGGAMWAPSSGYKPAD